MAVKPGYSRNKKGPWISPRALETAGVYGFRVDPNNSGIPE
jgi:hypothetical protein